MRKKWIMLGRNLKLMWAKNYERSLWPGCFVLTDTFLINIDLLTTLNIVFSVAKFIYVACSILIVTARIVSDTKKVFTPWTMKSSQSHVKYVIGCWTCPKTTSIYTKEKMLECSLSLRFSKDIFQGLHYPLTWSKGFCGGRGEKGVIIEIGKGPLSSSSLPPHSNGQPCFLHLLKTTLIQLHGPWCKPALSVILTWFVIPCKYNWAL